MSPGRWRYKAKVMLVNLGLLLVLLALVEGALGWLVHHPERLGDGLLRDKMRVLYMGSMRQIVQYQPACAHHDPDLGYRLRPGICEFENIEFRTTLHINEQGLRDEEVLHPAVIVLGDSHTMGWGVEQDETFVERLEKQLQQPVLNAGIASYGTVRELRLFEQLPTDSLQTLVIQYNEGDPMENRPYVEQGELQISSAAQYQQRVDSHTQTTRYWLGKYVWVMSRLTAQTLWYQVRGNAPQNIEETLTDAEEAAMFWAILKHHADQLRGLRIVVFESQTFSPSDGAFIRALNEHLEEAAALGLHIETLDVGPLLSPQHYYVLDDHMNPEGHRVVADALYNHLRTTSASP